MNNACNSKLTHQTIIARNGRKESHLVTRCRCANQSFTKSTKGGLTRSLALLLLLPMAAGAGGVLTNCTEAALRAAMAGGGTVTFACDGTITLTSTITNAAETTLDASGHQVTISGNGTVRVFHVNSNVDFTLINLTVANGFCDTTGAGILNGGGTVNATSVAFAWNSVVKTNGNTQGGAIRNELGTLNLEGCSFTKNEVWAVGPSPVPVALGGAIYNNGTMNAKACIFSANWAGARPYPQYSRDRQEGGQAAGGAVYSPGIARFEGCRFDANVAAGGRGGVFISECCIPTGVVDGADGGTGSGGAICNQGWLSVRTSSFMFNQAVGADGGDAYSDRSYWPASGASGGRGGSGYGAALDNEGTASIASSMFSGNNALGGSGGAACMGGGGPAEPGGSGGVGGDASGAAVFNGGSLDLVNCTIVKSGAVGGGGGGGAPGSKPTEGMAFGPGGSGGSGGDGGCANGPIWSASGQVGLTNCTIALNSGQAGLGGPGGAGGPPTQFPPYVTDFPSGPNGLNGMNGTAIGGGVGVQLLNTLIASDSPSNFFVAADCGHNLSSDASCAFTNSGSMNNTDPKLGPLSGNGGPTLTMALLPGSPAIDAGNTSPAPTTDQRGFPRPAGLAADIGAFEYGYVVQAQFYYTTNNGTITITGYWGPAGALTIPETINCLPVTCIGTNAFLYSSLTGVTIPRTVTNIGYGAFSACTALTAISVDPRNANYTSVDGVLFNQGQTTLIQCPSTQRGGYTIPNSVTSIGNDAFYYCGLTRITIPNSVTSIGDQTFGQCYNLTSVTIPDSVTSIGDGAFSCCTSLASVTIGTNVTRIAASAFCNCLRLASVTIPASVTDLGSDAFDGCTSLTKVAIPNSVTSIGSGSFSSCTSLTDVTIGNSVTAIGDRAFQGCSNLTSVAIPNSVTSIGDWAFSECSSLTNATVGSSVTTIASGLFYDCRRLTSLTIPNSVTSIGAFAFYGCWRLTNITLPNGLTNIGYGAFQGCGLTYVTIPNSVTSIGAFTFDHCTSLTGITIPNSVTNIGDGAFQGCYSLTSITIPNSVTNIGDYAFYSCTSLTSITIPNGVTSIGAHTFDHCESLANVTVGNGVTTIGDWAFNQCMNLAEVLFLGNAPGLTSEYPFAGDHNAIALYLPGTTGWGATYGGLPTAPWNPQVPYAYTTNGYTVTITKYIGSGGAVTIPSTIDGLPVTSIGTNAFLNCTNLTNITIPNSVTNIGAHTFDHCGSLATVTIGNHLTTIGDYAFYWCTHLASVTIPNSVTSIGVSAFEDCISLTSVTIGNSVTTIGDSAFTWCQSLVGVLFLGNAPRLSGSGNAFPGDDYAIALYLPGTTGWGATYSGLQTALWNPQVPYGYRTNGYTVTIAKYIGSGGAVTIPSTIDGLPVTSIGTNAFLLCTNLISITIPNSVTGIGDGTFARCSGLTSVTIPNSVTSIGRMAFANCTSLTSITIPNRVTSIGESAFFRTGLTSVTIPNGVTSIAVCTFEACTSLTSITIPNSVTNIGDYAFSNCDSLRGLYFQGNAPSLGGALVFQQDQNATVYYLRGTTGWGTTYGGLPTVLWNPLVQTTAASFGVRTNRFGFTITGTTNVPIVVEASTNLAGAGWTVLQTCTLTNGSVYFSDSAWTNYPTRFYRIRSP